MGEGSDRAGAGRRLPVIEGGQIVDTKMLVIFGDSAEGNRGVEMRTIGDVTANEIVHAGAAILHAFETWMIDMLKRSNPEPLAVRSGREMFREVADAMHDQPAMMPSGVLSAEFRGTKADGGDS